METVFTFQKPPGKVLKQRAPDHHGLPMEDLLKRTGKPGERVYEKRIH